MAMPNKKKLEQASKLIGSVREQLKELLAEYPDVMNNADHVLQRLNNGMRHMLGLPPEEGEHPTTETQPLTHILGQKIETKKPLDTEDLELTEGDISDYQYQVNTAYDEFLTIEDKELLERYPENVLRGVAIQAEMSVTPTEPKKITAAFIKKIKEAIEFINARDKALELATSTATKSEEE